MRICDRCKSTAKKSAEFKINLVRPEQGSGERTRNPVVRSADVELCQDCVDPFWAGVDVLLLANLDGVAVVTGGPGKKES